MGILPSRVPFCALVVPVEVMHLVWKDLLEDLKTVVGYTNLQMEGHGGEKLEDRDIPE